MKLLLAIQNLVNGILGLYDATGYSNLLEELSIDSGSHLTRYTTSCMAHRVSNAAKNSSELVNMSRNRHKWVKIGLADKRKKTKCVLYTAGGFN